MHGKTWWEPLEIVTFTYISLLSTGHACFLHWNRYIGIRKLFLYSKSMVWTNLLIRNCLGVSKVVRIKIVGIATKLCLGNNLLFLVCHCQEPIINLQVIPIYVQLQCNEKQCLSRVYHVPSPWKFNTTYLTFPKKAVALERSQYFLKVEEKENGLCGSSNQMYKRNRE